MKQVPQKPYGLIGSGQLAKHLSHYFKLTGTPCLQWSRKSSSLNDLKSLSKICDTLLLAISDDAIFNFINEHSFLKRVELKQSRLIHFSGSLSIDGALSAHPLMTFSDKLYDLETYKKIIFVVDKNLDFKKVFPSLNNKNFGLDKYQKSYYHALCVLSGNLPQIIWSEVSKKLEGNLSIPKEVLHLFLQVSLKNWIDQGEDSATGPFSRKDFNTIEKNLNSLEGDSLEGLYKEIIHLKFNKKKFAAQELGQ